MDYSTDSENTWSQAKYDVSKLPTHASSFKIQHDQEFPENFVRTANWCLDGSTVLAQCENRTFQLFDLPPEHLDTRNLIEGAPVTPIENSRIFSQPSPILDFVWYPSATPRNPASFCFVASVRESPVKLLDATDGRLRASYRIVDHRERQIAPHSLSFNLPADKLYCGFEDAIEVFDVHRPGEGTRLPTTPSKKSKDGLKGIISALSFSPSYDIYAAGSLTSSTPNIVIFSESEGEKPAMFVGTGEQGGVMQLHFNPIKPHILYAAFRRHDAIYGWDLRGDVSTPLKIFRRNSNGNGGTPGANGGENRSLPTRKLTNQRMRFDVDTGGQWLGVGDQNGGVSLFDLESDEADVEAVYAQSVVEVEPTLKYQAHGDAIGSVGFHPFLPRLLSVSGSRHFEGSGSVGSSDSESSDEDEGEDEPKVVTRSRIGPRPVTLDASVKVWNFE